MVRLFTVYSNISREMSNTKIRKYKNSFGLAYCRRFFYKCVLTRTAAKTVLPLGNVDYKSTAEWKNSICNLFELLCIRDKS